MHDDLIKLLQEVGGNTEAVGRKLSSNRADYWSLEMLEHMKETLATNAETIDIALRIYKRRIAE